MKYLITLSILSTFLFIGWAQEEAYNSSAVEQVFQNVLVQEQARKAKAEEVFRTAKGLYDNRKYEEAAVYFNNTLKLNPSHSKAKEYLMRVNAALGKRTTPISSQAEWIGQNERVSRQERLAELEKDVNQAKVNYEENAVKEWDNDNEKLIALKNNLSQFQKVIDLSYNLKVKSERDHVITKVEVFIKNIETEIRNLDSKIRAREREEAKKASLIELEKSEKYLENRIANLLKETKKSIDAQNYRSAIKLSEDILEIDPNNKLAAKYRKKSEELRHRKQVARTKHDFELEKRRRFLNIKDSFIPYTASIVYPEDWEEISQRQQKSLERENTPEWKKKMERVLNRTISSFSTGSPLPLQDVLDQLTERTGVNFFIDPNVTEELSEDELVVRKLRYSDITLRMLLNTIIEQGLGLRYDLRYEVVFVTNAEGVRESLIRKIYDIQHFLTPKSNFIPPELNLGDTGGTADEGAEISFDDGDIDVDGGELITGDELVELIRQSVIGDWDKEEEGIKIVFLANGSILIQNTLEVHNQIIELLHTLSKTSAMQIEVESRLLNVDKNFYREIGFDWMGLDGTENVAGSEPGYYNNDNGDIYRAMIFNNLPRETTTADLGFFLEHSILGRVQAKVLLRAIEQKADSSVLVAPRLLLVNNMSAYIRLSRVAHYISGYDSEDAGIEPVISSVDEGQLLAVTATVSSDRKYISLDIKPDFQTLAFRPPAAIVGQQQIGGGLGGGINANFSAPIDLPIITKQRVRTTAVIPDGGILVIGGVADSSREYGTRGVPFISKIPFLGRLFKSDLDRNEVTDLTMYVHGDIIIYDELEAEL